MIEQELINKVLAMKEVGYNASEQDSLPFLFKEVYGFEIKKCSLCKRQAFDALVRWAGKRAKPNTYMAYTIKKEFNDKNFVFHSAGMRVIVNAANLDEKKAHLMLASKYAHAIEGQPEIEVKAVVKPEKKKLPNESEVVTASTSKPAKAGVKLLKEKGKKKLSKSRS